MSKEKVTFNATEEGGCATVSLDSQLISRIDSYLISSLVRYMKLCSLIYRDPID
jgi:hypothetical protein